MTRLSPPKASEILAAVQAVGAAVRDDEVASTSWDYLDESTLWRELVAGILGSRTLYEVSLRAVETLETVGLLDGRSHLSRLSGYQRDVELALTGGMPDGQEHGRTAGYPFARQRAHRIRRSVEAVYGSATTIRELLRQSSCPREARRELARRVCGVGPKQASMFLRNIGFPGEFAILDSHVMDYMQWNRLLAEGKSQVNTLRRYEELESVFLDHARDLGLCPRKLDIAVWIVMRVAKRAGRSQCH